MFFTNDIEHYGHLAPKRNTRYGGNSERYVKFPSALALESALKQKEEMALKGADDTCRDYMQSSLLKLLQEEQEMKLDLHRPSSASAVSVSQLPDQMDIPTNVDDNDPEAARPATASTRPSTAASLTRPSTADVFSTRPSTASTDAPNTRPPTASTEAAHTRPSTASIDTRPTTAASTRPSTATSEMSDMENQILGLNLSKLRPSVDVTFYKDDDLVSRYRPLSPITSHVQRTMDKEESRQRKSDLMKIISNENEMLLDVINLYESTLEDKEVIEDGLIIPDGLKQRSQTFRRRQSQTVAVEGRNSRTSSISSYETTPPSSAKPTRESTRLVVEENPISTSTPIPNPYNVETSLDYTERVLQKRKRKRDQLWKERSVVEEVQVKVVVPKVHLEELNSLSDVRTRLKQLKDEQKEQEDKLQMEYETPPEQILVIDDNSKIDSPTRKIHFTQVRAHNMLTHGNNVLRIIDSENRQLENIVSDFDSLLMQRRAQGTEAVYNESSSSMSYFAQSSVSDEKEDRPQSAILSAMPYLTQSLNKNLLPMSAAGVLGTPLTLIGTPLAKSKPLKGGALRPLPITVNRRF